MKISNFLFVLFLILIVSCGPKPPQKAAKKEEKKQQTSTGSGSEFDQVIIASSSKEEKGQPLIATILNRVVGGAEGAFIGNKMDQLANQLERKFPGADVSRIGEGVLMKLDKQSDFYFKNENTQLSDKQIDQLKKLSQILSIYKETKIHLVNHTYKSSSIQKNQQLARKRGENIAMQMKEYQNMAGRIILNWHGHVQPSGNTDSNQRLEIGIIAGKEMLSSARKNISKK